MATQSYCRDARIATTESSRNSACLNPCTNRLRNSLSKLRVTWIRLLELHSLQTPVRTLTGPVCACHALPPRAHLQKEHYYVIQLNHLYNTIMSVKDFESIHILLRNIIQSQWCLQNIIDWFVLSLSVIQISNVSSVKCLTGCTARRAPWGPKVEIADPRTPGALPQD